MAQSNWTKANIPSQKGKLAIVTGATGGLGYETALALAEAGATVIVIGRNDAKGKDALERIKSIVPTAHVTFENVDMASLKSVKDFCTRFNGQHQQLDILVNNAGIMAIPKRKTTEEGFEIQFITNHLSHFALTAQLLPALRNSKNARVVQVSSVAHRRGKIDFDNLQGGKKYIPWDSYCATKLCNLLFMLELQRRSEAGGWGLVSIAAHPGFSTTDLIANGPGNSWLMKLCQFVMVPIMSNSPADGALPQIMAATAPDVKSGDYYGPTRRFEYCGPPGKGVMIDAASDKEVAKKLWDVSTTLAGVTWPQ